MLCYEANLKPDKPVRVSGVTGMKSRLFSKVFKDEAAMLRWLEKYGDDCDIYRIENVNGGVR